MKIKEFTKDYVLFDNNKYLTFEISNALKHDFYNYYFDFKTLNDQIKNIDENTLKFDKYSIQFAFLSDDEIYEDEIHYTYNCDRSEFSPNYQSSVDERNIGFLLTTKEEKLIDTYHDGRKMPHPIHEVIKKDFFVPLYKTIKSLQVQQIEELQNQIDDIEKKTDKYLNTKYTLEEKIASEVNIQILYDHQVVLKMNGFDGIELHGHYIHSNEEIHYDKDQAFKIKSITDEYIEFTNGKKLTSDYDYEDYICKNNYADFTQIDDLALDMTFYENELVFEAVNECGIRFGNRGGNMVFVPCYSNQNGYYTTNVDIYYDEKLVLHLHQAKLQYYGQPNKK